MQNKSQAADNGQMLCFLQDAAQALLGGMATSAANKGYNDNNSINGNDKNHGSWNSGAGDAEQIRGDAIHHRQGLPTVNHKGHGDDRSFLRGLRFFVKSTRGLVNSYWSTVARQQRERSRRMSNSKSKALDGDDGIEEAEGLLGRGAQRAGAAGATNGTLHRSWSSIAVGSSQGGSTMQEVELSDIEAGSGSGGVRGMGFDARELAGGGEAVALLPATEAGDGTGYGGDCALNSLRRGVRSRATTGDLILLARDEEQGAGEDSAQEDCKQVSTSVVLPRKTGEGSGLEAAGGDVLLFCFIRMSNPNRYINHASHHCRDGAARRMLACHAAYHEDDAQLLV